MPNNRKSKINRLPKHERTHPTSKILVINPNHSFSPSSSAANASQSPRNPAVPTTQRTISTHQQSRDEFGSRAQTFRESPELDDECLSKILWHAGVPTVLAALRINQQWKRVAGELLRTTHRLDLSKLYKVGKNARANPPTETQLLSTLHLFPNISSLTVRKWLYNDVMPHVAESICSDFPSATLKEVDYSGVQVTPESLVRMLQRCPNLQILKMGSHVSVNDRVLESISNHCRARGRVDYRLQCLQISSTGAVYRRGATSILSSKAARSIYFAMCPSISGASFERSLSVAFPGEPMDVVRLTSCENLRTFRLVRNRQSCDVRELHVLQCKKLNFISIYTNRSNTQNARIPVVNLRILNLAGCSSLCAIQVGGGGQEVSLANLEELSLFGNFSLSALSIASSFGMSSNECTTPKLRRLDLNGCRIEALVLIAYPELATVDCSGCQALVTLKIEGCWKMERLGVLGRRMPLHHVQLMLPAACVVDGRRDQWHWQSERSHQLLSFP